MTYSALPSEVRLLAERVLTEKQLEAWQLELRPLGTREIARRLGLHRSSVMDRLESAHLALFKAGVRQDANSDWYVEEAA